MKMDRIRDRRVSATELLRSRIFELQPHLIATLGVATKIILKLNYDFILYFGSCLSLPRFFDDAIFALLRGEMIFVSRISCNMIGEFSRASSRPPVIDH